MNWNKLQEMQLALDSQILAAKSEMTAEERFNKTLVALSVEISEVANCSEHFKFWKDNKGKVDEKRFKKISEYNRISPMQPEIKTRQFYYEYYDNKFNPYTKEQAHHLTLVEECSDCLHFILSLANQGGETLKKRKVVCELYKSLEDCYKEVARIINGSFDMRVEIDRYKDKFLEYVLRLGITEQELEQAYYEKNKINYERLREGY
ncbi:dUTP diphosphatase [Vagococcus vulneris]|uniref:dUTPase n=1 Tax=Vagococcus vulneris TaxID=1977869 RepID=A0A429ZTK9_9ENTE|nr:dUTP diphosphatase [Vagococcus vulneris]RST96960.1 hypothetical protein CBF37_10410 [Vagococcus vulneris]